ncbi:MAG: hypothetical protein AB8B96_09855 [Lysobacterales bacterium]
MNLLLISAALAHAAASDKLPPATVDGADAGQTVRIISLDAGSKSSSQPADVASPIYLVPPSPPLVAVVQEDGSIVYRHSTQYMKPTTGAPSAERKPQ